MMLRSKKTSREVSLYDPIGTDREGNEISLLDVTPQEQPDIVDQMELERSLGKLSGLIDTLLTEREKEIICLRYGLYVAAREVLSGKSAKSWIFPEAMCPGLKKGSEQAA